MARVNRDVSVYSCNVATGALMPPESNRTESTREPSCLGEAENIIGSKASAMAQIRVSKNMRRSSDELINLSHRLLKQPD